MTNAINREKLAASLELGEGLRLKTYRCTAGKLSIGIGRNLDDVGISKEEAYYLLGNDMTRAIRDCEKEPWWPAVKDDDVRARVIIEMVFNMGIGTETRGLRSFRNTLKALEQQDWARVAAGMRSSKWAQQVGRRSERLARMMETGVDL